MMVTLTIAAGEELETEKKCLRKSVECGVTKIDYT